MSFRFLTGCLLAVLGWPARGQAQVPDTTVVLPGITVTATRVAATDVPARVMVLDGRAMEAVAPRSVAALLEARAGAFVRRYGPGGLATLTLRGSSAAQTLVLLDGYRLADPQLGQLDLSLLPTVLLESVEVMHGAGAALYGTDAVGGVVNLRSMAATDRPSVRLTGTMGAFGEREGAMALAGRRGAFSALAAVEYQTSDGDFPYVNAALFPPRRVRRQGAGYDRLALYGRFGYAGGRHHATMAGWYNAAARGLPGPATTPPGGERQWDEHLRLWASDRIRLRGGTLRLGGLVQAASLRYRNPRLALDDTGRTLTASLEAEASAAVGMRGLFGAGLTGSLARARHPSLRDDAVEHHFGAFTHATLVAGPLRAFPALRIDAYFLPGARTQAALSPRFGVNVGLTAGLHLKAAAGRAFRVPTFNDRFWQPGGNPELRPEQGWTYDAGMVFRPRTGLQVELTAFLHRLRDQIVWQPVTGGYWAPGNVSRVRSRGLEASAEARLRPARRLPLEAHVLYILTDARDRSTPGTPSYDHPLRYAPRHQLKAALGAGYGRLRLDLSARYAGRRYVTTDGTQFLDPYWAFDGQLRLEGRLHRARLTLSLVMENLTNRAYEGIKGYPMPPRALRLRLRLDLPGATDLPPNP